MRQERGGASPIAWLSRARLAWLGAGLAAIGGLAWLLAPEGSRSLAAAARERPAVQVKIGIAKRANVPVYLEGLGTVQAFYTVKVTAQVSGELEKVNFTEGQHVHRGQLLAVIDPRPYRAALDLALATRAKDRAQLANAELDLKRYKTLEPQKLTSRQTLDTQRAQVAELKAQIEADKASIETARTELSYTQIRSPINGVTGIRSVDPGNIVHATDTTGIVVLTQLKPINVIFTLPEGDLGPIKSAMSHGPVAATALSQDGKTRLDVGHVTVLDNEINASTGTMRLKATFPNPHRTLWPGEFVSVRVLAGEEHAAVVVPTSAVETGPDGPFVYVVTAGSTVKPQPVKPGEQSGDLTVIDSGLSPGARVATSNQFRLFAGARVRAY